MLKFIDPEVSLLGIFTFGAIIECKDFFSMFSTVLFVIANM